MAARLSAVALVLAALAFTLVASADIELRGDRSALDARALDALVRLELGALAPRVEHILIEVHRNHATIELRVAGEPRTGSLDLPRAARERTVALFIAELARAAPTGRTNDAGTPTGAAGEATPESRADGGTSGATEDATGRVEVHASRADGGDAGAPTSEGAEVNGADAGTTVTAGDGAVGGGGRSESLAGTSTPERLLGLVTIGARIALRGSIVATPRVEGAYRLTNALRLGLMARYGYASDEDVLGSVSAHLALGGFAVTYALVSNESWGLSVGPRFEAGYVAGRGDGQNGTSVGAFAATVAGELELHLPLAPRFALVAALDAGGYLPGLDLRADSRSVVDLSGPFTTVSLGARW